METKQVYNPYLPLDEYIPDGEPHVFGDRVYVFGSHDREGGTFFCELDYVAYSADVKNLKDWRFEGCIYTSEGDPHSRELYEGKPRKYMYAPDVVRGNDGRYYLYYCLSASKGGGFDGPISVAVCDTPAGRYKYYGDVKNPDSSPMKKYIPFDPAVLNDKGRIFLYYGFSYSGPSAKDGIDQNEVDRTMAKKFSKSLEELRNTPEGINGSNVVELEEDMLTIRSEPARLIPPEAQAAGTGFEGFAFFEASSIRKVGDLYYFIYSTTQHHELAYAVSKHPDRDFSFGGVVVSNGDIGLDGRSAEYSLAQSGNNHGSIEKIDGQWYIFYHRHTHMTTYSRQACAEKIEINPDGSIDQVEMTSSGLNGAPLSARGRYSSVISCNLTHSYGVSALPRNLMPQITHRDDERFITNVSKGTLIGYKYFDFKGDVNLTIRYRGSGKGSLSVFTTKDKVDSQIPIEPSRDWIEVSTSFNAHGVLPLYFTFEGQDFIEILSFSFE